MEPLWYDAANPTIYPAGSIVFAESPDLVGRAIRLGEWLRWRGGCRWNHCAVTIETGTNPHVVQASVDGVTRTQRLSDLEGGSIAVVPPPFGTLRSAVIGFGILEVGEPYGYLTLAGIVVDQLLPRWLRFQIGRSGTWICSALAAECWRSGGWLFQWPNVYATAPAQLALAVGLDPSLVYPNQKQKGKHMTFKKLLGIVTPYVGAFLASALTLLNTDLTRLESGIMAGGPAVVAAVFNFIRRELADVHV